MSHFISWIEKDGDILFLTDEEIFSQRGKALFEGCKDHYVLGHEAIRLYCGDDGELLQGGVDYEVRDFWNTKELPMSIADLHPEDPEQFMQHWGQMWDSGAFCNYDLRYLVCKAPEFWKEEAWGRLLQQAPSNNDLCYIVYGASDLWREKAWGQLLIQHPSYDDFCYIVYYAPDFWREKAWDQIMAHHPSDDDLRCFIYRAPEPWKEKACAELEKRKKANSVF